MGGGVGAILHMPVRTRGDADTEFTDCGTLMLRVVSRTPLLMLRSWGAHAPLLRGRGRMTLPST
jgi:hypothetical protein